MDDHEERWRRLAALVIQRRKQLGMHSRADLIRKSGLSEPTVRGIETANPRGVPRDGTGPKLSAALRWTADSVDRILDGLEPLTLSEARDEAAFARFEEAQEREEEERRQAYRESALDKTVERRLERIEAQLSRLARLEETVAGIAKQLHDLGEETTLTDDDEGPSLGETEAGG